MSSCGSTGPGTGLPQSQQDPDNSIKQHEDNQSSVDDKEEHSSFLPKDQSLSNVAIGVLLDDSSGGSISLPNNQSLTNVAIGILADDSSEGSASIFLDSANSSVNMRQNESDDENGGVAQEKSQGISQELSSLLFRDIAIPHYSIPKPYHWDNHPETRGSLDSENDDDDEEQQQQQQNTTARQSQQGRTESTPFVIAHSRIGNRVSSHARQSPSDHDNGIVRRLFTNCGSRLEPQSLVADSPIEFGTSRQGYKDYNGPVTTWEQFHDEPYSLDYKRTVIPPKKMNKRVTWSGLEALPEDEYQPKIDVKLISMDSKKRFRREKTGRGIGLFLCILGLVILISTGITISLGLIKNRYNVQLAESSLTLKPTPAPSEGPTRNATTTPTIPRITFPPSGQLVVTVQVLNDGCVDFEELILRRVQVQNTTTLLVQEGFNLSAALSFIEFDTVTTVGPLSALVPWLVSATIQLTLAEIDIDDIIRLYAKLYPNNVAKQPHGDIIDYGSGQIDFQDGWIPFEISPNQTEMVDIDVTQFLQRQFDPFRTHNNLEDNDNSNVQVLLARDNSNGVEVQGASVRFFSSESASPSQRPRLILVLQAPDFSLFPAPTTAPIPTIGSTMSLNPTSSSRPITSPSDSPSLHRTTSPEPTIASYPSCSICGGLIFANPEAVITGVDNVTTCGIMQERALDGALSPKQCQHLQSQVGETCCHPIDNNSFICDLCGTKLTRNSTGSVVNLDTVVGIPELGDAHTCRYYQERANAGMISSVLCSTLQPFTYPTCCGILL